MREGWRWIGCAGLGVVSGLAASSSSAMDEHDAARAAVNARDSLPLEAIIGRAGLEPEQILDAKIVRTEPSYRYRVRWLDEQDRVREMLVDGRTGAVVTDE
ncbi:MAG: PepSY domain-containing protein [Pseudomonadota bacterium]